MTGSFRRAVRRPVGIAARGAMALRRALLAAADAVVTPQLAVFEQAIGIARTQLLHAAARLRIADLLDAGPRTARELATASGVHEETVARVLQALATSGIFRLRGDGRFENNRLSATLRSSRTGSLRDLLEYLGSSSNVASWADVDRTLATGRSAFRNVHGMSVWEWLARHPEEERAFAAAMVRLTELEAPAIAEGYPFGSMTRICDVGGGHGALLAEILVRHPRPRGVLLDAPQVVERARPLLEARGVAARVECVAGDLREAVPPGCDAYVLKDVLHDWDDATAVRILEACRRAARPGSRIVVAEMLLDRDAPDSPVAWVDVQMLMVTEDGRQRSAGEHHALLRRAGIRPGRVVRLPALASIVEGLAE